MCNWRLNTGDQTSNFWGRGEGDRDGEGERNNFSDEAATVTVTVTWRVVTTVMVSNGD